MKLKSDLIRVPDARGSTITIKEYVGRHGNEAFGKLIEELKAEHTWSEGFEFQPDGYFENGKQSIHVTGGRLPERGAVILFPEECNSVEGVRKHILSRFVPDEPWPFALIEGCSV